MMKHDRWIQPPYPLRSNQSAHLMGAFMSAISLRPSARRALEVA